MHNNNRRISNMKYIILIKLTELNNNNVFDFDDLDSIHLRFSCR